MKIKSKNAMRPTHSRSYLKHKLISATALLLVSTIMMVSTSYAWYVLSTAPEVSNIKTQVGANGALEIALLNKDSWNQLDLLDMGDIDESVTEENPAAATLANLTWGNLVNLGDASYGLDKITLNPARLYIEQDGNGYKVNSVPLKTPVYGEDGRVKSLAKDKAVAYTFANNTFSDANGYGVRAIGTSATMSVFQLGMNAARSSLVTYSSAARTAASNALNSTGSALANVVVDYAVSDKTEGYTETDVANIRELALGLQSSLGEIESALRQTFAGYITTTGAAAEGVTAENYQDKLAEVTGTEKTLSDLLTMYGGIADVIPAIGDYITTLTASQTKVENAIASCDEKLTEAGTATFSWSEISGIIYPLVNTNAMLVNGKNIDTLKGELIVNGAIDFQSALALVSGGITITVPTGSGILSDIADYAGDYASTVPVTVNATISGNTINTTMDVLMTTATAANPVYLVASSNGLKTATVAEASGSNSITDYYGYAIDLAFRTNAEESNLLLQTEPQNRIYDGDTRNASLQGAGSYMSFITSAGLSATKMVKLMNGLRVVLMDGDQAVLGIAALDCTLGKDVYTVLDEETQQETKMYAYLDGSAGDYQNSDLITKAQYDLLPDESHVEFNKTTGKVTAKLYMYNFAMTLSPTGTADDPKYTGGLTIGSKITSGLITALTPDVVQKVTALVYLDGSLVNNSTVAANSMYSMTGTLNLQFSSSAELLPAVNTQLQTNSGPVSYTELTGTLYDNGYLYFEETGMLGKINAGYELYEGSDDKFYYFNTADETAGYVELTTENITTALTPVTAALSPASAEIKVDGTTTLTAALSDADLTVAECNFVMSGDSAIAEGVSSDNTVTVTGKSVGEVQWHAVLKVRVGSGDATGTATVTLRTNDVTVKVAEASGSQS